MVLVGADTWDGTPAQLRNYRRLTGTRFPLLLRGDGIGRSYGPIGTYVIVDRDGIVRYTTYPRLEMGIPPVSEIRAVVDELLRQTTSVRLPTWAEVKARYRPSR